MSKNWNWDGIPLDSIPKFGPISWPRVALFEVFGSGGSHLELGESSKLIMCPSRSFPLSRKSQKGSLLLLLRGLCGSPICLWKTGQGLSDQLLESILVGFSDTDLLASFDRVSQARLQRLAPGAGTCSLIGSTD